MTPTAALCIGALVSAIAFAASAGMRPTPATGTWCAGDSACLYDDGFREVVTPRTSRDIAPDINFAVVVVT